MNKKDLIVQHNDLISGRHTWNTNEIKIALKALSCLNNNKLKIELSHQELVSLLNENSKKLSSSYLKNISKSLYSKHFEISKDDNQWKLLHWFREIEYNNGILTIEFEERLKPYLLNLKSNFTKYSLKNILYMKSNYSMRIYQLLKQYQKIGKRKLKVEVLRNILKVPESYTYNNFKKKVILKAKEEMEIHSDIQFFFKEIKFGKKIIEIEFIIKTKIENIDKKDNPWYYSKYYGISIFSNGIKFNNIKDIKEKNNILFITFENNEGIQVLNEEMLIKMLIN